MAAANHASAPVREPIPNVLAERYATPAMQALWSPRGRILLERDWWLAVLKAQRDLGLDIPAEAIAAYEAARDQIDFQDIRDREAVSRHDVKARLESWNAIAGYEHIHKGMTSRDLTENVEQLQVYRSLELVRDRSIAALQALAGRATAFRDLVLTARTHNVAAQPTTLGKRLAMHGEPLLQALHRLDELLRTYPARGLQGAVGTQLDQLTLFAGDAAQVEALADRVQTHLGLPATLNAVGQVYPRSLDHAVVSLLVEVGAGPSSFAKTLRLMAGHELASEGFAPGQTGSSAMPHKMNSRSCERLNGFYTLLQGYATMTATLAGDQWNEGDVACSVVRRVVLPDSFFAADGLLEIFHTILRQMEAYPEVIARENAYYFPFLATTTILMEAVRAGAGREAAHAAIKEHAVATLKDLRRGTLEQNDLAARLAADERLGLDAATIEGIIARAGELTGRASGQVATFAAAVEGWVGQYPEAAAYTPGDIL